MNWKFWQRSQPEPEYFYHRAPLTEALEAAGGYHVLNPGYSVGTRRVSYNTEDHTGFESTNASQWSTTPVGEAKRLAKLANIKPVDRSLVHIEKDSRGYHVNIDPKALVETAGVAKSAIKNPRLLVAIYQIAKVQRQQILDSALFL